MSSIRVKNYIIDTPVQEIVFHLQRIMTNGKLRDIVIKQDELVVTCPNDEHAGGLEAHPDCHINLDESKARFAAFHCFACGEHGSFDRFVALCFSSSLDYAQEWLIKNYGVLCETTKPMEGFIQLNKSKAAQAFDSDFLRTQSEFDTYQSWCSYLAKRNLSRDVCYQFQVKYDPTRRQVIFPIKDATDNLVMYAKRSIDSKIFYMTENADKPVYGLNMIKKYNIKTCMVVEGLIDMLTCWTHGVPAVAMLGEMSPQQIESLNKSELRSLYLAFDNDWAGKKFNALIKKSLSPNILTTDVQFPAGKKDPNDLSDDEWNNLVEKYFKDVKFQ